MSFPSVKVEFDPEDLAGLISFIDFFLPKVNTKDPDSKAVALNVWEQRENMRRAMGDLAKDVIPEIPRPV